MKTFRQLFAVAVASLLLAVCLPARAAVIITNINLGSAANAGTGDSLRSALTKTMTNFHRLNYGKIESTNGVSISGNVLTSDGTNWYGATPTGGSGGTGEVSTAQLLAASNAVWIAQAAKAPTNNANIGTTSSSGIPLTLRAAAGQDGNMLNVRDGSGSIIFAISYDGQLAGVGANSARLASTSVAGEVWTASDTTGIGAFAAIPQQTNSSIARQTELTTMSNTLATATAGKQQGSFVLTNFMAMGITNIVSANANTVITTNSGVLTLTTASGGASALTTNANQFGASVTLTIKDGALLTNTSIRTALTLPTLTVSRAAVLNSSGQLTNSAAVSDVELEYLDGVTSAIQTQLGTKMNGATNSSQFGASVTLSISSGALLTNLQVRGIDPLGLTASRALSLNANGDITNGTTTAAELEFVNGVTSAIQTQLNGKQNGQTNSSQFGASTTLTLADRLSVTNLNSYGTGAVFSGHVTVASNITSGSFIGAGTGTPYLLLSSPNGAAFGITVDTNRTVQTSNTFNFSGATVGQAAVLHSGAAGINVWTNGIGSLPSFALTNNQATSVAFLGDFTVTDNITSESLSANLLSLRKTSTGVPIIKLQTMMSADNSFAITVATNRTATTTNIFDFTSVSAAQVISAHSSSAGQVVWTNATAAAGGVTSPTNWAAGSEFTWTGSGADWAGMGGGWFINEEFLGDGVSSSKHGVNDFANSATGGGAIIAGAGENGTPGVYVTVTTNTSDRVGFYQGSGSLYSIMPTNVVLRFVARVRAGTVAGDAELWRFGLGNDITGAGSSGIYLRHTNGVWQGVTCASSSFTVASGSNSVAQQWTWLGWELDSTGTNVVFYQGGTDRTMRAFGTNNATIPHTAGVAPISIVNRFAGTTARQTNSLDVMRLFIGRLP